MSPTRKSEVCDVCDVNLYNRELIRKDRVIDLIRQIMLMIINQAKKKIKKKMYRIFLYLMLN